jgi:hypothetical protein
VQRASAITAKAATSELPITDPILLYQWLNLAGGNQGESAAFPSIALTGSHSAIRW